MRTSPRYCEYVGYLYTKEYSVRQGFQKSVHGQDRYTQTHRERDRCDGTLVLPITPPRYVERSMAISLYVCLSVREHISGNARSIFTKFVVLIPCGRGSVLLWYHCYMLCTFGVMDDVTFGRNGPHSDKPLIYY